jgi:drug/metabolite transporter (DMT)-like permease
MAGTRFLIAGSLILAWVRLRTRERPQPEHWKSAAIIGTLLLMGGNGAVTWAEQRVPSGVAALMVAITPCIIVLIDWLRPEGVRPAGKVVAGLALGLGGVAMLIGPDSLLGGGRIDPAGALVLLVGSLCWSTGSIYSRHAPSPSAPLLFTGMQMVCGGGVLTVAGLLAGEAPQIDLAGVSMKSVLAFVYLILFGAIVGYSAYIWLMRVTTPARAATYAYVNPVVAVLLGWLFAGESLTGRMLAAAVVIIGGVALITISRSRTPATRSS